MKKILYTLASISILFVMVLQSCEINSLCSEEFVEITVTVNGDPLDEHYTIATATGKYGYIDTLQNPGPDYIVLNDNYRQTFENMTTTFRFVGKRNGVKVIEEDFVIKADECHIEKISGPTEITY